MEHSKTLESVYFDRFEVDRKAHQLLRDEVRVALQEQPFQVLLALLEAPGEVVTRDTLRRRLWGADTFVDFNQSMNSAVRRLRQALGDDPEYPVFIETIPRVGYRFIAQLMEPKAGSGVEVSQHSLAAEKEGSPDFPAPNFRFVRSVSGWFRGFRWRDPVVAIWFLVIFAGTTLLPWEVHLNNAKLNGPRPVPREATGTEPADVTVVPLRNLTGNQRDQYVADGITEALTTKLAEQPGLRVRSQFPPDKIGSGGETLEAAARQRKMGSMVGGAVRRQGDQVWITTRLFDAKQGTYLWADTYMSSAHDLAKDEIPLAEEIAREVNRRLTSQPEHR